MNKVILIGNLGADPERRHTQSGLVVVNLSLATEDRYTDKSGERQKATEWHRVTLFGKTAEIADRYLSKGSKVMVEGAITTEKWEDNSGQARYTTKIKGQRLEMLGGPPVDQSERYVAAQQADKFDDDIPF